jgi:type IV pilus assembly protein PilB
MAVSTEVIDLEREQAEAERLASRYRLKFVKLEDSQIDYSLIQQLPVDLMLRHRFVPLRTETGQIVIAMADPSDFPLIDELRMQLNTPVKVEVATWSAN